MSLFVFKVCGIAAISSMLILLIKKWGGELAVTLKIAAGLTLAAICFGGVSPIIAYVHSLETLGEIGGITESVEFMLQILAVAIVSHVSATICRDCGENSLGGYVELGGKIEIIVLSLPWVEKIIEMTIELL